MIKSISVTLISFLAISAIAQDHQRIIDSLQQVIVEEHKLDLNKDGQLDRVLLKEPPYGDPGQFNSFEIILSSGARTSEQPYGLDFAENVEFDFKNRVNSKLVYIPEHQTKTYIFLFGYKYGCCLKQLICYEIKNNKIIKIHSDELQASKIGDFNNDGTVNIEGYTHRGEIWSSSAMNVSFKCLSWMNTFDVRDTLTINKNLTYQRNQDLQNDFGNFLEIEHPVIATFDDSGKTTLISFQETEEIYDRVYWLTSSTKIRNSSLQEYSKKELRLMRNEIFAAHGYIFKSEDLKEYFGRTKWYNPRYSNVDDKLTDIEKYNIKQIVEIEKLKSP